MSDPDLHPSVAPPFVSTTVTAAVVAVALATRSVVALAALVGGAALAVAVRHVDGDPSSDRRGDADVDTDDASDVRSVAAAHALIALNLSLATVVGWAHVAGLVDRAALLAGAALWVAAAAGFGIGRGVFRPDRLFTAWATAFASVVAVPVLVLVGGISATVAETALPWALALHLPRPALGSVLALAGVVAALIGVVVRSGAGADDAPAIDRQLREVGDEFVLLGKWLFGAAAVAWFVGEVVGVYGFLRSAVWPAWWALAVLTSSTLLRALLLGAALAVLAVGGVRLALRWSWSDDGFAPERGGSVLLTIFSLIVAAIGAAVSLLWPAAPSFDVSTVAETSAAAGPAVQSLAIVAVALVAVSAVMFLLGATADSLNSAPGVLPCTGALLAAAIVIAATTDSIVAPLVAVAAAMIVWDSGRVGARMGAELGAHAPTDRGALVRVGGSVATGAVGAVVAIALAALVGRFGRYLYGPIVRAIAAGLVVVLALLWYVRRRESSRVG